MIETKCNRNVNYWTWIISFIRLSAPDARDTSVISVVQNSVSLTLAALRTHLTFQK